ncbi:MAG: hypothetical protein HYV07_18010 [Deltaproteobacteria bacterium]|nr:hypothetical protein [Deltaproteobacteria bacterium]
MRSLLGFILVSAPAVADASFFELYGFNPRALGTASAQLALSDDFTAVFYNPAGLATDVSIAGVGLAVAAPSLDVHFERPDPKWSWAVPPSATTFTFGSSIPVGSVATPAAIGVGFGLPAASLLAGRALDSEIPQWVMYEALPNRIVALLGFGIRPVRWLSLGASVQVLAALTGVLDYELDLVSGRFSEKTVRFDIVPRAAPVVGARIEPFDGTRLAVVWRGTLATDVTLPVKLDITSLATLAIDTSFIVQYQPHRIIVGAAQMFPSFGVSVDLEASLELWSAAPDPSVATTLDAGGELLEGTGLAGALDAPAPGQERIVELGFRNVVVPRLGIEKTFGDTGVTIRGGYALRPSPAPVQSTGTNYIDGTSHTIAAGASLLLPKELTGLSQPFRIDGAIGVLVHPSRRHDKVGGDDPVGSFDAGGSIFTAGISVSYGGAEP